eukprot:TRINITY_DN7531_c0_g1_i7.p1 TRINITY_DN7531_c0_g1~~TRINITY_DN7531_c0_g1_i7.p1  ORF type:complete len:129 (+),score=9.58 TRINITY_DN7531_c0_g1_i7:177-563(+)
MEILKNRHVIHLACSLCTSNLHFVLVAFVRLQEAYEVLSDPRAKAEYDNYLRHNMIVTDVPVSAEVDLDDMTFVPESTSYEWRCRCGDTLSVSEDSLLQGAEIFTCPTCSLNIRILADIAVDSDPSAS